MSKRPVYGYPCVTNPYDFDPDFECCSPTELEAHKLACANWRKPSFVPNKGCFSLHSDDGQLVMHVTRTSWGIGTNLIDHCDGCGEPTFDEHLMMCHECGGPEFCAACWPKHEKDHDEGIK